MMKYTKCVLAAVLLALILCGCGSGGGEDPASGADDAHEPLTILYSSDVNLLKELVAEKYPEIQIQVIPYKGNNWSRFTCDQMITGDMPDIYNTTYAWTNYPDEMKANLLELSSYDFTDKYDPTLLAQQELDGEIYLLPSRYNVYSCAYNKTLLTSTGGKCRKALRS